MPRTLAKILSHMDCVPHGQSFSRIADRERSGIYSSITKTAEMIRLEVANEVAGLNARITIEVDRITSEVNDTAAGLSSKIEQTATSLTAKITATDGRVSSLSPQPDPGARLCPERAGS